MNVNPLRVRPRRSSIGVEEERAWVSFYRRVGHDPVIAAEVLAQLDGDAEMKREHLALYLCCRESLRLHQAREARNQRIGQFVRWLAGGLFLRLAKATGRTLCRGGDIALACLPEANAEPATKAGRLAREPKIRAARTTFKAPSAVGPFTPGVGSDAADVSSRAAQAAG